MRRAAPALLATAGALGLLTTFHTAPAETTHAVATAPPSTDTTSTPTSQGPVNAPETAAPTTTAAPTIRSATGPDMFTRFGDVQVQAVLQGGRLVDVRSIRLPFDRARSQRISDEAAPRLRNEALQAQSAQIDLVSGATYTSEGYIQSLQGALDALR
jgi:uncharacterized protein with FMN-binding domain